MMEGASGFLSAIGMLLLSMGGPKQRKTDGADDTPLVARTWAFWRRLPMPDPDDLTRKRATIYAYHKANAELLKPLANER